MDSGRPYDDEGICPICHERDGVICPCYCEFSTCQICWRRCVDHRIDNKVRCPMCRDTITLIDEEILSGPGIVGQTEEEGSLSVVRVTTLILTIAEIHFLLITILVSLLSIGCTDGMKMNYDDEEEEYHDNIINPPLSVSFSLLGQLYLFSVICFFSSRKPQLIWSPIKADLNRLFTIFSISSVSYGVSFFFLGVSLSSIRDIYVGSDKCVTYVMTNMAITGIAFIVSTITFSIVFGISYVRNRQPPQDS